MYEELVNDLREDVEWAIANTWEVPIMLPVHLTQAADAVEELEEKAQAYAETLYAYEHPWIPVSSALPEDGSDILAVQSYCGEVRIVPANYDRGVWYDCVFNRVAEHITHWMQLPQPPTECRQMVTDSNQVFGDSEQLGEPVSNPYKLEEQGET